MTWQPELHATYCPQHYPPPEDGGGSSWLCCCTAEAGHVPEVAAEEDDQ